MKVKIATSPTQSELEEMDLSSTTRKGAECIIGRSPDSDLVLDSNDVSRYHGKFFYHSGNYYFSDLGSKNGTIINGKLLEQNRSQILKNGDVIRIGDFALMLEEDIAISEQSETVVRIINPSMFSNWQGNQNKEVSPELVNQAEQEEVFENYARQVNTPDEITFAQSDDEGEQKIAAETSQETPDSVDVNLEESDDEGEQEIAAETSQENPDSVDVNLEESDDEGEQEIA
ncbi:MAG: FHA domain-containing protein, partial [Cyanobacteria bacterium P01_A01_bin.80]